jgi:hypothetical protein
MSHGQVGHTGITWHKALACNGGHCVEVAVDGQSVLMADSRRPDGGPVLSYTFSEWRTFLNGAKNGDFDHLLK